MSNYVVRKVDRGVGRKPVWELYHEVEGERSVWIGAFTSQSRAETHAKVLAGWRGKVTVEK